MYRSHHTPSPNEAAPPLNHEPLNHEPLNHEPLNHEEASQRKGLAQSAVLYVVAATIFTPFALGDFGVASAIFSQLSMLGLSCFFSYNVYTGMIKPAHGPKKQRS